MTKSAGNCGFEAFTEKIPYGKLYFLCSARDVNALEANNGEFSLPKFPNNNFLHFISNNFQKPC